MIREALEKFLEDFPNHPVMTEKKAEDFYTLGFSLYNAGSFDKASQVFQVLCCQKPLDYKHWFGLASSLQEERLYEKALSAWAMAAILNRTLPYSHFHAAECAFSLNRKEEAALALEAALVRANDYPILQDQITLLKEKWSEVSCQQ